MTSVSGRSGSSSVFGPTTPRPSTPEGRPFLERLVTPALVGGVIVFFLGFATLLTASPEDQVAALAVIFVGAFATAGVLRIFAEPADLRFLARVAIAAVLLRVGLSLLIHTQMPLGFFAPDQATYQSVGMRTLLYHQGQAPQPWQIQDSWEVGYFYWNAFLFWIFGFAPLAPKLANCFLGAWTGLVAYRIGGELVGKEGARGTAVLASFFPSLVLWSSLNLRDPVVVLFLTLILLAALRLRVRVTGSRLAALVGWLALLSVFRDYMAVMIVFALVGSFVISPARRLVVNLVLAAGLFGLAVLAYQQLGLGSDWIESATFDAIGAQRELLATGGSAFRPGTEISTPLQGLTYLPIGLAFFLLAPFPWQIGSTLSALTLPEMLVWYVLLGFVVYGAWHLVRLRFNRVEPILIFSVLTASIYALVEGNAGTAYRHRAQLVVFFLIFAAVGIEIFRRRRETRRRRRTAGLRRLARERG